LSPLQIISHIKEAAKCPHNLMLSTGGPDCTPLMRSVALGIGVDANGFEIATKIPTYLINSISARDLYKDYSK